MGLRMREYESRSPKGCSRKSSAAPRSFTDKREPLRKAGGKPPAAATTPGPRRTDRLAQQGFVQASEEMLDRDAAKSPDGNC